MITWSNPPSSVFHAPDVRTPYQSDGRGVKARVGMGDTLNIIQDSSQLVRYGSPIQPLADIMKNEHVPHWCGMHVMFLGQQS